MAIGEWEEEIHKSLIKTFLLPIISSILFWSRRLFENFSKAKCQMKFSSTEVTPCVQSKNYVPIFWTVHLCKNCKYLCLYPKRWHINSNLNQPSCHCKLMGKLTCFSLLCNCILEEHIFILHLMQSTSSSKIHSYPT